MSQKQTESPDRQMSHTDEEIISRVIDGDKELYAVIIRRYNQRLYRIAMSILRDESMSEEAMQVTYIKAYEYLSSFRFNAQFSTWLTRILINECLRVKKLTKQDFTDIDDLKKFPHHMKHDTESKTPLARLLQLELKNKLETAIDQLPEKYRTVFVMREIENMNVAETGESLQLSESNVKVRLNRAKVLLRNSLSHIYQKEDILQFHLTRCDRIVESVMRQIRLSAEA